MDLNKLRYFVVTSQLEHVTKAARQLNMTQPALTRALHKLEDELGVKLFVREGRNVRLTVEGLRLRDEAAPAIAELERAEASLHCLSARSTQTVRLCIQAASVLAVDAIASFTAGHPGAIFEVTQDGDRLHDVFIGSRANQAGNASAHFEERIGVALPASSVEGAGEVISLARLEESNFISLASTRWLRRMCDAQCAVHGFVPRITYESDNPSVVRKMIALGLGVGFWPEKSWGELDSGEVRWVALAEEGFCRSICVSLTPSGMEKPLARDFRDFLLAEFEMHWKV